MPRRSSRKSKELDPARVYKGEAGKWCVLSTIEQYEFIDDVLSRCKTIECFNKKCLKKFEDREEFSKHLYACFLPTYFHFMGKDDEFRALHEIQKLEILKESISVVKKLPCLNLHITGCQRSYYYADRLLTHMQCCIDPRKANHSQQGDGSSSIHPECDKKLENEQEDVGSDESRNQLRECRRRTARRREYNSLEKSMDHEANESNKNDNEGCFATSVKPKVIRTKSHKVSATKKKEKEAKSHTNQLESWPNTYNLYSSEAERNTYQHYIDETVKEFETKCSKEPLCPLFMTITYQGCERLSNADYSPHLKRLIQKRSISIVISNPKSNAKNPNDLTRIRALSSQALQYKLSKSSSPFSNYADVDVMCSGSASFCGGPISAIETCPRQLKDDRECVAVSVFHSEEHLVEIGEAEVRDYIQLWLFKMEGTSVVSNLWFLLETLVGAVLSMAWCPSIRRSKYDTRLAALSENLIGVIAVGGIRGEIPLYGIFDDLLGILPDEDNLLVYRTKPFVVLHSPEVCMDAPIFCLAWTEYHGGSKIAAVSAYGAVLLWNLNDVDAPPIMLLKDYWDSPPMHVIFCDEQNLVIAFREKLLRFYNPYTKECLREEVGRIAGIKVAACERLFEGVFAYQGELVVVTHSSKATTYLFNSGHYISTKDEIIPICNRHAICLWDLAVCSQSGAILTVGTDGQLIVSLNGRIAPRKAERKLTFKGSHVIVTVRRKSILDFKDICKSSIEGFENEGGLRKPIIELEDCAETTYLELCFDRNKNDTNEAQSIPHYIIDRRTESLNKVTSSKVSSRLAICGGEAGILIFLPTVV